jgi:phosphoglycerate dehydrogenase-like enzyme
MPAPLVILWHDNDAPYREAISDAGLAGEVQVIAVKGGAEPPANHWARCEALLAFRPKPGLLPKAERLRWVQTLTAGVEGWLALPDLPPTVTLTCARGTHRVQMPENILGALFHITKPYAAIVEDQKQSKWTRRVSDTLAGKTLGILGLGAIGVEVAKKAAALEMRVIGTKVTPGPVPHVERVYSAEETGEVLAQSDFVLLLLPVTPGTRGFIDSARLAKMKPSAHLLNFGRGELIVDADLVDAVQRKVIAGAILDVFAVEPLPVEHPFWRTPGITVLPHIGGLHPQRDTVVAELFVENLKRFLAGQPLLHAVDRARGY